MLTKSGSPSKPRATKAVDSSLARPSPTAKSTVVDSAGTPSFTAGTGQLPIRGMTGQVDSGPRQWAARLWKDYGYWETSTPPGAPFFLLGREFAAYNSAKLTPAARRPAGDKDGDVGNPRAN